MAQVLFKGSIPSYTWDKVLIGDFVLVRHRTLSSSVPVWAIMAVWTGKGRTSGKVLVNLVSGALMSKDAFNIEQHIPAPSARLTIELNNYDEEE